MRARLAAAAVDPRRSGSAAIGSAVIAGMVLLVTLWFVSLPFSFADLWWQHHWGLGPFDVAAWLGAQWSTLGAEAVSAMATIVLAGRARAAGSGSGG